MMKGTSLLQDWESRGRPRGRPYSSSVTRILDWIEVPGGSYVGGVVSEITVMLVFKGEEGDLGRSRNIVLYC